ncbi:MAG TPA: succinylglutamate desuccinylase/aspartoacylase family protein [Candidatus Dormibacteraeota bacterium]
MSGQAGSKTTARLDVPGQGLGPDTFVPYGSIRGAAAGPDVAVVAGVHGTELVTQDAVQAIWRKVEPKDVTGSLTVIFVADVLAAQAGIPGANPVDGRNLNRVWPGSSQGTFSERLADRIWTELLSQSEIVVDVHGGEWTEEVTPFAIIHQSGDGERDQRTLRLGDAMGLPHAQTSPGVGTLSGAVSRSGRIGLALEVGGGGRRSQADADEVIAAVIGVLAGAGLLTTTAAAPRRRTVHLQGGDQLRTSVAGVLVQQVELGQAVEAGQTLSLVTDFDGTVLEEIRSSKPGLILLRGLSRVVAPGALAATVGWPTD